MKNTAPLDGHINSHINTRKIKYANKKSISLDLAIWITYPTVSIHNTSHHITTQHNTTQQIISQRSTKQYHYHRIRLG